MPNTRYNDEDFDERGLLRDGHTFRTSVMLMDSLSRAVHQHYADAKNYGLYPPGPGMHEGAAIDGRAGTLKKVEDGFLCVPVEKEDAMTIDTDNPAHIVDAFGNDGLALNKPGIRHLHAGHRSVDYAVQVTREAVRDKARAEWISEMSDAWKGEAKRTGDEDDGHHATHPRRANACGVRQSERLRRGTRARKAAQAPGPSIKRSMSRGGGSWACRQFPVCQHTGWDAASAFAHCGHTVACVHGSDVPLADIPPFIQSPHRRVRATTAAR
jgi:hypothetical protein